MSAIPAWVSAAILAILAAATAAACNGRTAKETTARPPAAPPAQPGMDVLIFEPDQWMMDEGYETGAWRGFAMVQDRRHIALVPGRNEVRIEGVARTIRESSVTFRSFLDPAGTVVRAQKYLFDGADATVLLTQQIGSELAILGPAGEIRGKLVSYDYQGVVIDTGVAGPERLRVVPTGDALTALQLAERPGGFATTPALLWDVDAARGGDHLVEITYETQGLTWRADHTIVLDGAGQAQLRTLITLDNQSGQAFAGVGVKLVAEEVERTRRQTNQSDYYYDGYYDEGYYDDYYTEVVPGKRSYHVMALPGPVDVPAWRATQVVVAQPAATVPARTEHRFEAVSDTRIWRGQQPMKAPEFGRNGIRDVVQELVVANQGEIGLPGGRVLVYEGEDPFLKAESFCGHSPANGELRVRMGTSATVRGERKATKLWQDPKRKILIESFQIAVTNSGAESVNVKVIEHMYRWKTWELKSQSAEHEVVSPRTIAFPLSVGPGETRKVKYEVEYNW